MITGSIIDSHVALGTEHHLHLESDELLSRMDAPVSRCDEDFGVLGDADLKTLIRLLDAVRAGLSRPSKSSRRKA